MRFESIPPPFNFRLLHVDYIEKAKRVFETEAHEIRRLSRLLDSSFSRAVETILHCVEHKGKIIVIGIGKSGHIGEKIAATLTSTGSPAVVLNSLNALHGDLGVVADGDVVLALSYSGETDELLNVLPALSRFGVKIISICGNAESTLAKNSYVHLDVHVEHEACPLNLAPTSSTTVMLVLGDALAMVLLEARGFKKEDFARYHPGGRLGRTLLLKVTEIMRGRERIAIVAPDASIRAVLRVMAKHRAGSALVTHSDGSLAGIFTHGDFGRHFESIPDLLERPVGDYMTRKPVTIGSDRLAAEVLHVLEKHAIDDLVVVDGDGAPVGVVDSQDLAKLKLVP